MKLLHRLAATLAAGALLTTSGLLAEAAPVYEPPTPAVTVYNTPGVQYLNGRTWRTACSMYSSNVVRCRTEIWATQVVRVGSGYRQHTGWAFNNLTYLPAARGVWAGNNLAQTVAWVVGGRSWRTECDTEATGRNGCRTYLLTSVVARLGSGYVTEQRWVFNNQVLFATASLPAVTSVPRSALQRAVLTPTGFGPVQLGTPIAALHGAYLAPGDLCSTHSASPALRAQGINLMDYYDGTVGNLWTTSADTPIGDASGDSGFRLGMTLAQLRAAFPGKVTLVTRDSEGGPFKGAAIREGSVELLFSKSFDAPNQTSLLPTDVLVLARAREASSEHFYGC